MDNVAVSRGGERSRSQGISSSRMLQQLLFAHLLLVSFQIPLRAMVLDTTFIRDVLLIPAVILWVLVILNPKNVRITLRLTLLDYLFAVYLLYGMFITALAISASIDMIQAFTQFRNHFLPAALFFVAKMAFSSHKTYARLTNIFLFLAIIMVLDVIFEYLLFKAGFSKHTLPWYQYTFQFSPRYVGNVLGVGRGYILPEHSPILGLLGWGHATAAALMVLFAFSYPGIIEKRLKENSDTAFILDAYVPNYLRRLLVLLTIMSIMILQVTTHIITLLLVLLVIPIIHKPAIILRNLLLLSLCLICLIYFSSDFSVFSRHIRINFSGTEFSESTIRIILNSLNQMQLYFIAGFPIDSILFGDGDVFSSKSRAGYSGEMRILFYTVKYGIVWLFLYLCIYFAGLLSALKIMKSRFVDSRMRLFANGTIGLLAVCLLDMGHYARQMTFPIIDIWAICLGALSAIEIQRRQAIKSSVKSKKC